MTVPICPDHGTPMRPSSHGAGFYCSKKIADGTYCKVKVAGAPATTTQPAVVWPTTQATQPATAVSPQMQPSQNGKYALAAASLTAASWVWGQVDPTMHAEVAAAAKRFYAEMEAMVRS